MTTLRCGPFEEIMLKRFYITTMMAVIVFLFVPLSDTRGASAPFQKRQRTISVRGEALYSAKPDLAIITFGVISQAVQAASALSANSQSMVKLHKTIRAFGIAEKDVQTNGFNMAPQYESGRITGRARQIVGYLVRNQVTVRLRDLSHIGLILKKVGEQGANRIFGIRFIIEKTAERMNKLRKEAIMDALKKASTLAKSAGVKLGKVIKITEDDLHRPKPHFMLAAPGNAQKSVPIALGESHLHESTSVTFAIN